MPDSKYVQSAGAKEFPKMLLPKVPENTETFAKEFPNLHKLFLDYNVAPWNNKTRVDAILNY